MFYHGRSLDLYKASIWTFLKYKFTTFFAAFFIDIAPSSLFDLPSIQRYLSSVISYLSAHTCPMNMVPDPNDNLIYHLDRDGKLVEKLRHTDGRANCLTDSIDVFKGIKKTDRLKSALARGAAEFCERYPAAWFLEGKQGTREEKMAKVALEFLEKSAIADFIAYCISDRLRHREVRGSTTRKPYDDSCPMSSERMLINGVVSRKLTRFICSLAS